METLNKLDNIGSKILTELPALLEKGLEYGSDLFVRYVEFHAILNYIGLGFALLSAIAFFTCLYLVNKHWKRWYQEASSDSGKQIFAVIVMIITAIFTIVVTPICAISLAKINTVPEIYVIDKLTAPTRCSNN